MKIKKAYQYIRISQEDQSNFSITGQKRFNESYASRVGCEIVKTFIDDGRSAKDFNRPQWQILEKEIYRNRHRIDYLIISKYDRLIRNVREGLVFLEKMENKWGVRVVSAMEDYYSHPDDPMFIRDRTQRLLDAEVERLRISDRVKFGHWQAANEGRYVFNAPFGYVNSRDENNKPILAIDEGRAEIIRFIFRSFVSGAPMTTILKKARSMGFTVRGNSALQKTLSNHLYAGLVSVKAYRNENEKIVKGIHGPIVTEQTYYAAQSILKTQEYGKQHVLRDDFPLRGVLACIQCGELYTGGKSRGRSKTYRYYRCDSCARVNLSAPKMHEFITGILSQIQIPQKHLSAIRIMAKSRIEAIEKRRRSDVDKIQKQISVVDSKIESLTEKFIMDDIDKKSYEKFRSKYEREKSNLENELPRDHVSGSDINQFMEEMIPLISDMGSFFEGLSTPGKQLFFSGLFGAGSKASLEVFEPLFTHPIFGHIDLNIKGLRIKKDPEKSIISGSGQMRVTEGI